MAIKANQWLKENGFITEITRGRRTKENQIRLHEAYLSGIRFSDWEPAESTDSKGEYTTVNAKPIKNESAVVGEIMVTYPEHEWQAEATVNGKTIDVSMRECCDNCYNQFGRHSSLTGHWCLSPSVSTVLANGTEPTPVRIVKRTKPLPNKLWK